MNKSGRIRLSKFYKIEDILILQLNQQQQLLPTIISLNLFLI